MTARPWASRSAPSRSRSIGRPPRCTGMIARVRGVIAAAAASRSIRPVPGSLSTRTGVAPTSSTALAVATNVIAGTSTSSPGPIAATWSASVSAAVHDDTQRTWLAPRCSSSARSKRLTFGPAVIHPERRESTTSAISSSPMSGVARGRKVSRIRDKNAGPRPFFCHERPRDRCRLDQRGPLARAVPGQRVRAAPARSTSTSSSPTTPRRTGRPRSSRGIRARVSCAARTAGSPMPTTAR